MNIGIDHGYYAIKTRHCSFPAGLTAYGSHEPYTRQGLLESGGCFFVCGTGRQPIQRDKTINDNYYLLTLAALAQEIRSRGAPHGVYNPDRCGPAADQLWPGQAEIPQLPASSFPAGSVPLRGCGIQHHHRGCAAISPGLCRPDG